MRVHRNCAWALLPILGLTASARGQEWVPSSQPARRSENPQTDPSAEGALLPPTPSERPPFWAVEFHLQLVFPISDGPLCPPGAACVFDAGTGIGGGAERRFRNGVGFAAGYDAWFLDGNGAYELSTIHTFFFQVRKRAWPQEQVHPFIGIGANLNLVGDTFKVDTVAVGAEAVVGLEIELTEALAINLALPWRAFLAAPFETSRDGVERAEELGINSALAPQIGFSIAETP